MTIMRGAGTKTERARLTFSSRLHNQVTTQVFGRIMVQASKGRSWFAGTAEAKGFTFALQACTLGCVAAAATATAAAAGAIRDGGMGQPVQMQTARAAAGTTGRSRSGAVSCGNIVPGGQMLSYADAILPTGPGGRQGG